MHGLLPKRPHETEAERAFTQQLVQDFVERELKAGRLRLPTVPRPPEKPPEPAAEDVFDTKRVLDDFDSDPAYGPRIGLTRAARHLRAVNFSRDDSLYKAPPPLVAYILSIDPALGDVVYK